MTCNNKQTPKELFNKWAVEGDDERAEKEHTYAVLKVLNSFNWADTDNYLDIGCGNGYTLRHVATLGINGPLVGFDISDQMIEKAKLLSAGDTRMNFICADFMTHDFAQMRFDKIFSMEAFYYFSNVALAIKKAHTLLKDGGTFACVVDYYTENKASEGWPAPDHCNIAMQRHSMAEWKEFFIQAGFANVSQSRIIYPKDLALEEWQTKEGSLVTTGRIG